MNANTVSEIRNTLERTLMLAQQSGMTIEAAQTIQYQDEGQILNYNTYTDELSFYDAESGLQLTWRNGELMGNTQILLAQLAEFEDQRLWLDEQGIPDVMPLMQEWQPQPQDISDLQTTAANLFDTYMAEGIVPYSLGSVSYYSLDVEGITYFLSHDQATDSYNLQREGTDLDVQQQTGITFEECLRWNAINQTFWETRFDSTLTYWDQQEQWTQDILATAERFLGEQDRQGKLPYDVQTDSYRSEIGGYEIQHYPETQQTTVARTFAVNEEEPSVISWRDWRFFQKLEEWLDQSVNWLLDRASPGSEVAPIAPSAEATTEKQSDAPSEVPPAAPPNNHYSDPPYQSLPESNEQGDYQDHEY